MRYGLLFILSAVAALAACDGNNGTGGGGSGGTGASGGTAATGGSGGTTATGGSGGSGGSGGAGATGGAGGSGGTGGTTSNPSKPQCDEAVQCKVVDDCCNCVGVGPGEPDPICDIANCEVSACDALGKSDSVPLCVNGQCVAGLECNHNIALCDSLPPDCPAGQTAVVINGCWGPCVPTTECASVGSCAQCDGGLVCIEDATQVSSSYHCVAPPPECSGPATCECFAASVCVTPFTACSDGPQGSLICTCMDC